MNIEHIAIWTRNLEELRAYYCKYFKGTSNEKYSNPKKGFESYFISFDDGSRLELMKMKSVPENMNDTREAQHLGIIHIAFGVKSNQEVDELKEILEKDGFEILSDPRVTGDGYYEFETLDPDGNRLEVTTVHTPT